MKLNFFFGGVFVRRGARGRGRAQGPVPEALGPPGPPGPGPGAPGY